jgi:hypothetical protein
MVEWLVLLGILYTVVPLPLWYILKTNQTAYGTATRNIDRYLYKGRHRAVNQTEFAPRIGTEGMFSGTLEDAWKTSA